MCTRTKNESISQQYPSKVLLVSLLWIFLFGSLNGQNDIELNQSAEGKHDSLYFELFKKYINSDIKLAKHYVQKSLILAKKHHNVDVILKSLNGIGVISEYENNPENAIQAYLQAEKIAIKYNNLERLMYTYCNLGLLHSNLGAIDKSLQYSFKALKISTNLGNLEVKLSTLNNIGVAYAKIHNDTEALAFYSQCLDLCPDTDIDFINQLRNNIAFIYIDLKDFSKAADLFEKVLKSPALNYLKIDANYGLGRIFFKTLNITKAKFHLDVAINLCHQEKDFYYLSKCLYKKGEILFREKEYTNALTELQNALVVADSTNAHDTKHDIYHLLSKVYSAQNEFQKSHDALHKAYAIKDSLFNDDFAKNFKNIHVDIANEKSDIIIQDKEAQLERQQMISIIIAIVAFFTILLVIVLWKGIQYIRRSRNDLARANETIGSQNAELTRFNQCLERLIDERTVELQLSIKSLLKVNNELDDFIHKTSKEVREPLASLEGLCNVALVDIDDPRAIHYFHEFHKTTFFLQKIFKRLLVVNQINKTTELNEKIKFNEIVSEIVRIERSKGPPKPIDVQVMIAPSIHFASDRRLVRLILENLISNAFKFYDPSESVYSFIQIEIHAQNKTVMIAVTDNGVGIDYESRGNVFQLNESSSFTSGISLYLTKLACERLGGQISLEYTHEGFTQFNVIIASEEFVQEATNLN